MATQGVLSFIENDKVKLKIVTGCDGGKILKLADHIKTEWPEMPAEVIYEIARDYLGCDDCLVVMTPAETVYKGFDELSPAYRKKFEQPKFNPRWALGSAAYCAVIGQ